MEFFDCPVTIPEWVVSCLNEADDFNRISLFYDKDDLKDYLLDCSNSVFDFNYVVFLPINKIIARIDDLEDKVPFNLDNYPKEQHDVLRFYNNGFNTACECIRRFIIDLSCGKIRGDS